MGRQSEIHSPAEETPSNVSACDSELAANCDVTHLSLKSQRLSSHSVQGGVFSGFFAVSQQKMKRYLSNPVRVKKLQERLYQAAEGGHLD